MFKKKIKPIIFGAVLLLGACSEVSPFVDSRREAGQVQPVGQSRPDRPAVCYNPIWDSEAKIIALADEVCAEQGKKAVREDTAYFNCRFVTPHTAIFTCQ